MGDGKYTEIIADVCENNLWEMSAVIADARDNSSRLGTSSAELVMQVSHPVSNTSVCRLVNVHYLRLHPAPENRSRTIHNGFQMRGEFQWVKGHFAPSLLFPCPPRLHLCVESCIIKQKTASQRVCLRRA